MNKKLLIMSGVVALVVAAIALTVSSNQDAKQKITVKEGKDYLFPGLLDNLNQIAKINLEDGNTSLTMVKISDTWCLSNEDNYPVEMSRIRENLIKLGNMTLETEKTNNPELYSRIQVEDVIPGATGKQIDLYDEKGDEIASVILGKVENSAGDAHQFIRKTNEKSSWLTKGNLTLDMNSNGWLDKEALNIDGKRPASVTITHNDGSEEVVEATRIDSSTKFELKSLPEGREIKSATSTREFSRIMGGLSFSEVKLREKLALPKTPTTTTVVQTFDGLVLTANTYSTDGKSWVTTFNAKADEGIIKKENSLRQQEADEVNKAAEEAAATAATETQEGDSEVIGPPKVEADLIDAKEIVKEAEELDAKISQWAYTFPSYITERFTRNNEYYLKEVVVEEEVELEIPKVEIPEVEKLEEIKDTLNSLPIPEMSTPPLTLEVPTPEIKVESE
jgi:uncharacterized protein DUF4340